MDNTSYGVSPVTGLSVGLEGAKISSLKKKISFSPKAKDSSKHSAPRAPLSSVGNVLSKENSPSSLLQTGLRVSTPPGRCGRRFIFDENSPVFRSPSRYTVVVRQRNLVEESEASSQDSGISEGSFRFAEPSGFAPKRTESPRRCLKFSSETHFSSSVDSDCFSQDGFTVLSQPEEDTNSCSNVLGPLIKSNISSPIQPIVSSPRPRKRRSSPALNGAKKAKPLGDRASEENKGTLFQYGFTRKAKLEQSDSDLHIKMALQRSAVEDVIGDFSRPFALPLMSGKHQDLKSISSGTLAKLINGEYDDKIASFKIVDCRYPYEYEGGHIKGAVNLFTCDHIVKDLLDVKTNDQKTEDSDKRDIVIFHCEFSSERGPFLSRFLRKQDRAGHEYPNLAYPELYLLHGGYKAFFAEHKELCEPQSYRTMQDPAHTTEFKHFRAKSKSWAPNHHRKQTIRSLSRLGF